MTEYNCPDASARPVSAKERLTENRTLFSVCTLVTRPDQYEEMLSSYASHGFSGPGCEFLYLDNSNGNEFDAFAGYNIFLSTARGRYIILCHQDILFLDDDRWVLERRLAELDRTDPHWALCGNAGGAPIGRRYARISDPHGTDQARGPFPAKVSSLDENFIVVRRDANLGVSRDLQGFHLYGTDLCLVADLLGRSAWVIDFHLRHKGAGVTSDDFFQVRDQLIAKYHRAYRSRWITTTCTHLVLSGLPLLRYVLPLQAVRKLRELRRSRVKAE